jgi:hypothetical protein
MPVYFGIPLRFEEAFRLFNLNFEEERNKIMKKYNLTLNMYMDYYFIEYLNNFFKSISIDIRIFYIDKGQSIIGYEIEEVSIFNKKYANVDTIIILLRNLKKKFKNEIENYEENFEEVILEHLEDDPEIVKYPDPYIIYY